MNKSMLEEHISELKTELEDAYDRMEGLDQVRRISMDTLDNIKHSLDTYLHFYEPKDNMLKELLEKNTKRARESSEVILSGTKLEVEEAAKTASGEAFGRWI